MASTATWILSLKILFISTGVLSLALGLKISVPLVLDFSVSQAPVIWSSVASWLRPPFLFVIINGIIITIAASSLFHRKDADNEKANHPQMPGPKITADRNPNPTFEYEVKSSRSDFGAAERSVVVFEQKRTEEVVEAGDFVVDKNVVVEDLNGDGVDEFVISESERNLPGRMDSSEVPMEILLTAEKPLVSARFGHRKLGNKASPEGGRSLKVTKPKRHETMENTWKMITEKKAMPLSRHLKKSDTFKDTWENPVNVDPLAEPSPVVKKSETFKDRTNFQQSPAQGSSSPASVLKLRKEPSLGQDELNRRVEAFIKKFNEEMRLQRQESLNQYKEMIDRGSH